jgi:protein-tyrosine phosphatase
MSEGEAQSMSSAEVEALQAREAITRKHNLEEAGEKSRVPSEIIAGFLWLSDATSAIEPATQQRLGITHVVNATNRCVPNRFQNEGVSYHNADLNDDENNAIAPYFEPMYQFVSKAQEDGGHVLVHCICGISRSATLVIAYVMKNKGVTLREAFEQVKGLRPIAAPNPRFAKELMALELDLQTQSTGIPQNTISQKDMVNPNYKKANANAAKARSALDGLGGPSKGPGCAVS